MLLLVLCAGFTGFKENLLALIEYNVQCFVSVITWN